MVIVRLMGGLGNQLFQYAMGRAVAHRHSVPLKLDISAFDQYTLRSFRLAPYNISASPATQDEINKLTGRGLGSRRKKIHSFIQRCLPYYYRSVVEEQQYRYDPNMLKVRSHVYLKGYWQSEKYFGSMEDLLRRELRLRCAPTPANGALLEFIKTVASVSLHVRRGDYASNPMTSRHHGLCSMAYYESALERLTRKVKQPHFFVFSDDMSWVKQNLKLDFPVAFVEHNDVEKDYEDLRLMSQCKHHIIANSTFSWWGAWLCENPDKMVIAPEKWFNNPDRDAKDIVPDTWYSI